MRFQFPSLVYGCSTLAVPACSSTSEPYCIKSKHWLGVTNKLPQPKAYIPQRNILMRLKSPFPISVSHAIYPTYIYICFIVLQFDLIVGRDVLWYGFIIDHGRNRIAYVLTYLRRTFGNDDNRCTLPVISHGRYYIFTCAPTPVKPPPRVSQK